MHLIDLLTPSRTLAKAQVSGKKRLLELCAKVLAAEGSEEHERALYDALCARERMGSTGLGHGVAIPHGRSSGISTAVGAFVQLEDPIDFGAHDGEPVDLIFALAVPEHFQQQHLVLLSQLAELFGNEENRKKLRDANQSQELYAQLSDWYSGKSAAA